MNASDPTTAASQIDAMLARKFGALRAETGVILPFSGVPQSDYLIALESEAQARLLARQMRERGVASGVRAEVDKHIVRLSKNDLIAAMAGSGAAIASLLEAPEAAAIGGPRILAEA